MHKIFFQKKMKNVNWRHFFGSEVKLKIPKPMVIANR